MSEADKQFIKACAQLIDWMNNHTGVSYQRSETDMVYRIMLEVVRTHHLRTQ